MLLKRLRDDQTEAIYEIREAVKRDARDGRPCRMMVQAPTGFGKGLLIADIVDRARDRNKRVLITVPAISLVDQTAEVLWDQGVKELGVIQAQHTMTNWEHPVQVASVQTLRNRWFERQMPRADVVLTDEAHLWFKWFEQWLLDKDWSGVPFIGFSATPWTKGLGSYYSRLVTANTIGGLIEQGTLVPFRTFAAEAPDLSEVRTHAGDFVVEDLDRAMRPARLVANIVETWKQHAPDRPTVCFCCSRAHAEQVAKEFADAGVASAYMDCDTPLSERAEVRRAMVRGEVKVVCNVQVVGLGVDWPEVSCISYCRPTMSDMRFVQNIGRGLRAAEGKADLLILDHSTTTMRLGFVDEVYALHRALEDGRTKPAAPVGVALPKECPACHMLKPPRVAVCPHCGHRVEAHAEPVPVERGTLREIRAGDDMADPRKRLPDKPHVFGQLWWWGQKKGYKPGWAAVKTKEIFGSFPRDREPDPGLVGAPVPELLEFVYSSTEKWKRRQVYARRKAREGNGGYDTRAEKDMDVGSRMDRLVDGYKDDGTLISEQDWEELR